MPNWFESMQQTFEYYTVNPATLGDKKPIHIITSSSIDRDASQETLGHASFDVTESIDECYVRIYLVTIQNGIKERFPLATVLAQTPGEDFNGKHKTISIDAYTPLLELKDDRPPIGYTISQGEKIMKTAGNLTAEHIRVPVVTTSSEDTVTGDFVANTDDTWLSYISDFISCAKYRFDIDEMGRILFSPIQDIASLQPVVTFDDGNSSILYPEVSIDKDMYGIPNTVEVIYSDDNVTYFSRVENTDPDSPVSTVSRGRTILYRDTNPSISGNLTQETIDEYAKTLLESLSTIQYKITFTHGYYPVRLYDCVRLNYKRAGLNNVKAQIISQQIKCEPGCPVEETAIYTRKLWEG